MSETGYIFRRPGSATAGCCRLAAAPVWCAAAVSSHHYGPMSAAKAADAFARSPL